MPFKSKTAAALLILLMLLGCTQRDPTGITGFAPDYPGNTPAINRAVLKVNENYTTGYVNGNIRSDQVTLSWTAVNDPEFLCYKLYRDGSPAPIRTWTTRTTLSYTDTDLTQDTFFDYKIAALNQSGMYTTDTVQVKTLLFDPPGWTAIADSVIIDSTTTPYYRSVLLRWVDNAEYSTSFQVERSVDAANFVILGTVPDTTYTDPSMGADSTSTFYYRIRVLTPYETSDPSIVNTVVMH